MNCLDELDKFYTIKVILASNVLTESYEILSRKALHKIKSSFLNTIGTIRCGNFEALTKILAIESVEDRNIFNEYNEPIVTLYATVAFNIIDDEKGAYIANEIENMIQHRRIVKNDVDLNILPQDVEQHDNITIINNVELKGSRYNNFEITIFDEVERKQETIFDKTKKSLLPCPFCGKLPEFEVTIKDSGALKKYTGTIFCNNPMYCNVSPKTSFTDSDYETVCKMVSKHWNTRKFNSILTSETKTSSKRCIHEDWDADGCYCKKIGHIVYIERDCTDCPLKELER
jgi:hypothetical protein